LIPWVLAAAALAVAPTSPAAAQAEVSVHLELNQELFYEGDHLRVRVSVRNNGGETVANPVKIPLLEGITVRRVDGSPVEATGEAKGDEPERPGRLAAESFYGGVFDLTEVYPALADVGTYLISWRGNGLLSGRLTVQIVPRYDPSKQYSAEIVTDQGSISLRFMPEQSPLAVKAFVDMARADFYDGLAIHEVRPDEFIAGGDHRTAVSARSPFKYPLETSQVPLMAGTVVMKPAGASPPANGSEFIILLRPQPTWAGQVTILGQVVHGLDVVKKISRLPSNGRQARPYFKPLTDLRIQAVEIREEGEDAAAGAPSAAEAP
jgi:cyclophilin family peptidyl-prolyl cis-trans isomerase